MNKHNYEPVSLTNEGVVKTYKMQCTYCNDVYWLTMPNISIELAGEDGDDRIRKDAGD